MAKTAKAAATPPPAAPPPTVVISDVIVGTQQPRVAYRPASDPARPVLLMFNGIGANLELALPFMEALGALDQGMLIFDIPGVGGSLNPAVPYRPGTLARLAHDLVATMGLGPVVDVAGVSWGGGLAQQFARQYPEMTRRLILVATTAGVAMVPGNLGAIFKMVGPKRYIDKGYMRSVAGELYGGAFRKDPSLINQHAHAMKGATQYGYILQLTAMVGWTSIHWLHTLKMPTLVLAGTDDPLINVFNAKMLARLIPDARLALIDDGHLFVVTQPRETAQIVVDFLHGSDGLANYPKA